MMVLKKLFALALAVSFPLFAAAQTPPAEPPKPGEQQATPPTPPPAQPPSQTQPGAEPKAKPAAPAAPKVSVTPYGFVQGTAFFDANTFSTKDYPGQVSKAQSGGAFLMSARYSRFGVKLALDDGNWTGATLGGDLEFDFKAGFVPTGTNADNAATAPGAPTAPSTSWYNGLMRLRLADLTATWKAPIGSLQVLAGQNYGLVTPLFATTIAWTADPLFWQAGNTWRRGPQFRVTATGGPELFGANVAVAMLTPQTADGTSPDYGSGNASRMPDLEGRLGINAKLDPVTVAAGVGYSMGKRRVTDLTTGVPAGTLKDIDTSFVGVDVSIGSTWADLKGEWFSNDGRDDTYNGIASYPTAGAIGTTADHQKPLKSTGYWGQLVLKPIPEIWIPVGYGFTETNKTSLADAGITAVSQRDQNSQLAGGVIVNAGKFWKFGVEGVQTKTRYIGSATSPVVKQTGNQIAVSTQLVF
jgi:hypothetical protein